MDAIELLNHQHDEVDELFEKTGATTTSQGKEHLFIKLADALAIHTTLEEKIFYPAVRARRTEEILLESLEEHREIKRTLADLVEMDPAEAAFDERLQLLKEEVEAHVAEEKTDLFPKVRKLFEKRQLELLAAQMQELLAELEGGSPRNRLRSETQQAAPRR